ncbi:MAG: CvpA family protein [Georgfuchsia sp.]
MTIFDYSVLAGVALSVLLGFWRGVVSEVLALVAWVLAFILGRLFAPHLALELSRWITDPALQYLAAFLAIAVAVLLLAALVRLLVSGLLRAIGLGWADRFLGAMFGLARGVLLVLVLVAAGGLTTFPKQQWWHSAVLAAPLQTAVVAMKPWLPLEWASKIRYR